MMKRILLTLAFILPLCSCSVLMGVNWDAGRLFSAAGKALTAASISDAEIVQLSAQSVAQMDKQNRIDAGAVGAISSAVMGDISEAFLQARFSQKQEFAADEYGFLFSTSHGKSPYSMATALEKIVKLQGQKASEVAQMFSSHPDSAKRASKMRQKADDYLNSQLRSLTCIKY